MKKKIYQGDFNKEWIISLYGDSVNINIVGLFIYSFNIINTFI